MPFMRILSALSKIISGVFGNRCPACRRGHVFHAVVRMNRNCPSCSRAFEREPGYFLGASMAAYFIGGATIVPTLVIGFLFLHLPMLEVILIGTVQLIVLTPFLWRYSRLTWLHVEQGLTIALDKKAD